MSSRNQTSRLDSIIVKTTPLLKCITSNLIILRGIPNQHVRRIRQADTIAERLDSRSRCIEHIIRINDTDLISGLLKLGLIFNAEIRPRRHPRSNKSLPPKIIEVPAQLVVPSFQRRVIIEARHFIQRGNRATEIRGDTEVRVAD